MLFVTDFIQILQRVLYQGSSKRGPETSKQEEK